MDEEEETSSSSMVALWQLSLDLIFQIMSRTSLKTLDTCKMVNSHWNTIAYESSFMPRHAQRTKTLSGYLLQTLRNFRYVFQFIQVDHPSISGEYGDAKIGLNVRDVIPNDVKIWASSKLGILCCCKQDCLPRDHQYYICKPSTGQLLQIPNPRTRFWTEQIALVVLGDNPLRYKIIRLSNPRSFARRGSVNFHCEIFDSEKWAWRRLEDLFLPLDLVFGLDTPVHVGGNVYWRLSDDSLLGFDVYEENFFKFFLPDAVRAYPTNYKPRKGISEYGGRLGFYCNNPQGFLEIWVLRGGYRWVRKEDLNLCLESVREKMEDRHVIPAGFYNAGVAVMDTFDELVFYNLQDGKFKMVRHDIVGLRLPELFPFRSDFEPVDLRGTSICEG